MKRVYLAGPDVFFPNAWECADKLKEQCAEFDLEGVFPLDAVLEFPEWANGPTKSRMIFEANVDLLKSCDAVLSNMMPFRGPSMDIGTGWEMGYGSGRGIPVAGYLTDPTLYKQRVANLGINDGNSVEDFDIPDNLMVIQGATVFPSVREACQWLSHVALK